MLLISRPLKINDSQFCSFTAAVKRSNYVCSLFVALPLRSIDLLSKKVSKDRNSRSTNEQTMLPSQVYQLTVDEATLLARVLLMPGYKTGGLITKIYYIMKCIITILWCPKLSFWYETLNLGTRGHNQPWLLDTSRLIAYYNEFFRERIDRWPHLYRIENVLFFIF